MAHIYGIKIGNDNYLIEPTLYSTASGTNTYTASFPTGFELVEKICVQIKFTNSNTAAATLNNVPIYFNGAAITAGTIKANHIYPLVYDGTNWNIVSDIDTWRPINNTLTSDSTDTSLSAAQGKALKGLIDNKADSNHNHNDDYAVISHSHGNITNDGKVGTGNTLLKTVSGEVQAGPALGTDTTKFLNNKGEWAVPAYTINTDEKVKQTPTTTDANYELLFSESANNTELTESARKTSTLKYNPNSKTLTIDGGTLTGTNYSGKSANATAADAFSSNAKVELTGDVTGSSNSTKGWTISATIGNKKVTPAKMSDDATIGIGSQEIKVGDSFNTSTLLTDLGLSSALHYRGASDTIPPSSGTYSAGDVLINSTSSKEYVYDGTNWRELGDESSFKIKQTAVSSPSVPASGTTTATAFIDSITQDVEGVITATKKNLPTASSSTAGITKLGADGGAATYSHTHGNITSDGKLTVASYAVVTDANKKITTANLSVSDPSSGGNSTDFTFIDTISQNTVGKITPTKKTIPTVSSSTAGLAPKGTTVSNQSASTKFLREDGSWAVPSYTTNTDQNVKQNSNTENKEFSILLKTTNDAASETGEVNFGATTNKLVTINPSTGRITAPGGLAGKADSAENADNATTATNLASAPILAVGTTNTNQITVTVGGQTSNELMVPYATVGSTVSVTTHTNTTNGNKTYYLPFYTATSGNLSPHIHSAVYLYETVTSQKISAYDFCFGASAIQGRITLWDGSSHYGNIRTVNLSANRTYDLPNQAGTFALLTKTDANALINLLDTGSSDLTANDYVITQYVGGGTTTTTYHRRPASKVINATLVKAALGTDSSTTNQWLNKKGGWSTPTAADIGAATSGHNHDTSYLKLDGSNNMTGALNIKPNSGEGGEIHLHAVANTEAGIVLDHYGNSFRVFGIASADGTTKTGTGTPLVIDPYEKTITGGYTLTGTLNGNASTATSWANARKVYVALGTASKTTTINGGASNAAAIALGIDGTLAVGHGGTGANSANSALVNLFTADTVGTASGDFTDSTIMITSNNSGSTDNWYRRTGLKMWNYIKSKADSIYAGIDALAVANALVYKGVLAGAATTDSNTYGALTPAANCGDTYKVSTAGFINGLRVEVGDMLICTTDETPAAASTGDNIYTTIRNNWNIIQTSEGSVSTSSTSSTDNAIARFDGESGRIIQTSGIKIDDKDNLILTGTVSSGSTGATASYDETRAGPKIIFNDGGQKAYLIADRYDSTADNKLGFTLGLVTDQSTGAVFRTNGIKATSKLVINNTFDDTYNFKVTGASYLNGNTSITGTASIAKMLTLTGTAADTAVLKFSRSDATSGYNYIEIPASNAWLCIGGGHSSADTWYRFTSSEFRPERNNEKDLGSSDIKWKTLYAVNAQIGKVKIVTGTSDAQSRTISVTDTNLIFDVPANQQIIFQQGATTKMRMSGLTFYPETSSGSSIGTDSQSWEKIYATNLITDGIGAAQNWIAYPGGGTYTTNTATVNGALKITLPVINKNTMMSFDVHIYTYNGTNASSVVYHISGYCYSNSGWHDAECRAYSEGKGNYTNLTVRYGADNNKPYVTIGEANTSWSYPQVAISNVLIGYSNQTFANWGSGWSITFVTTLPSATTGNRTNVNTQSINITGNAATATSATSAVSATTASAVAWSGVTGAPENVTRTTDGFMSKEDKIKLDDMEVIIGTQTASTNKWTGTASKITALYDGLTIKYYLPWAGTSTAATLKLTLADGTETAEIGCYYGNNTGLTTHYAKGSVITLTYFSAGSIKIDGTATTQNRWIADANYDSDNDYRTRQTVDDTTNANRALILAYRSITDANENTARVVYRSSKFYANPSTGDLYATTFNGALSGNATTATGATNDSDGNAINSTYFKLTETRAATTSNTFSITNSTPSGSTSTGALKVTGGIATGAASYLTGSVHIIGNASANPLIVRGIQGCEGATGNVGSTAINKELYLNYNGGGLVQVGFTETTAVATNMLKVAYISDSSSTSTGALVVDGGMGIAKKLYVGSSITSNGDVTISKDSGAIVVHSTNSTNASIVLERHNGTNMISSWKWVNSSGTLTLQNNWTGGTYFNVVTYTHTSGNVTINKGIFSAPYYNELHITSSNQYKHIYFSPTNPTDSNKNAATISYNFNNSTEGYIGQGHFRLRAYSPQSTQDATHTGYFEEFCTPLIDSGLTENKSYTLLTTKSTVTVGQGGTGATSFTADCAIVGNGTSAMSSRGLKITGATNANITLAPYTAGKTMTISSTTGAMTISTTTAALTISTGNGALEAKSTGTGTVKLTSNSGAMILSTTSGDMSLSSGGTVSITSGSSKAMTITGGGAISMSSSQGITISNTATSTYYLTLSSANTFFINKPTNASIIFTSGGADGSHEKARFNTNGNLHIDSSNSAGTQNTHKLYVKGDSAFEGKISFGTAASNAISVKASMEWNETDKSIDFIFT